MNHRNIADNLFQSLFDERSDSKTVSIEENPSQSLPLYF